MCGASVTFCVYGALGVERAHHGGGGVVAQATDTLYNDQLILKTFLFQFVNSYSRCVKLLLLRRQTCCGCSSCCWPCRLSECSQWASAVCSISRL